MEEILSTADYQTLKDLRQVFIGESTERRKDYWSDARVLGLYDRTFARRIGWKWDAVLDELKSKGGFTAGLPVVDFGCGTGVASEKWLERFSDTPVVHLFDRSRAAMKFAEQKLTQLHPGVKVELHPSPESLPETAVWLVSHVVNELGPESARFLTNAMGTSAGFVWVEPGTHAVSRTVIAAREHLGNTHTFLAPCPHQARCGLFDPKNADDWCHQFASPPREIYQSSFWKKFGDELSVDLRGLPVSYLVGVKGKATRTALPRVLGRARVYKGYALAYVCRESGVSEEKFMSRDDKAFVKELDRGAFDQRISEPKEK